MLRINSHRKAAPFRPTGAVFAAEKIMLAHETPNTDPAPRRSRLRLINSMPTTPEDPFEVTNREFLAALGDTAIEDWYRQNGLGSAEPMSTADRMAGLTEKWNLLTEEVDLDLDNIAADTQLAER